MKPQRESIAPTEAIYRRYRGGKVRGLRIQWTMWCTRVCWAGLTNSPTLAFVGSWFT